MPENVTPAAPAATETPAPTPAPKSKGDFQAAALAALTAVEKPAEEPAEEPKADAASAEEPAADAAPEEKPAAPAEKPARGFDALVREKAMLRKEKQELEAQRAKHAATLKAIEDGDILGAVQAAGFTHEQYVQQMLAGKKPGARPAEKASDPVLSKVEALEKMLLEERAQNRRQATFSKAQEIAKANEAKLPWVMAEGGVPLAMQYLEQYYTDTGELPAATMEESLQVALEAVEAHYEEQAKAWEARLTKVRKGGSVPGTVPAKEPSKDAVQQAASGQAAKSKTLTTHMSAPAKPSADDAPKTTEDYRRKALALWDGA